MSSHLAYLTAYLNKCKELYNDHYHNYPFVLDACVREFGISKKDLQDKSATCYFWPIFVQDIEKVFSSNQVYLIIQDKDGIIVYRGPIAFDHPNLFLKFRKDKNCFATIVDNALANKYEDEKATCNLLNNENILPNYLLKDNEVNELLTEKTTTIVNLLKVVLQAK